MTGDLPRRQLLQRARAALKLAPPGSYVHFKYTCAHCGERCVLDEPNTLRERGECYACGGETTIAAGGYMLIVDVLGYSTPAPSVN